LGKEMSFFIIIMAFIFAAGPAYESKAWLDVWKKKKF
jgi:hypothetical protein